MADFEIKMIVTADTSGATKTAAELEKVGKAHEEAGKKAQEAHEKTDEGAGRVEISERELRESVGAVGRQFGGLADVGLWLNPMTAALAVVLLAVEKIKGAFELLAAPVEAFNEAMAALDTAKLKAAADSAAQLSSDMAELAGKIGAVQDAFNRGTAAMENRIKQYGGEKDAILKVAEAEEKAYESELDRDTKRHPENKAANDGAAEQAKLALDRLRDGNEEAKIANTILEHQTALNDAKYAATFLDEKALKAAEAAEKATKAKAAAAATEADNGAKQPFDVHVSAPDKSQGNQTESFKNVDEGKKRALELRDKQQDRQEVGDHDSATRYAASAAALETAIKGQEQYIENLQTLSNKAKAEDDAAKAKIASAKADVEAHAQTIVNAPAEIDSLQADYNRSRRTNRQAESANRDAAGSRAGAEQDDAKAKADARARERDPAAFQQTPASELPGTISRARDAIATAKSHVQSGHGDEHEIVGIFNELVGLVKNLHATAAEKSTVIAMGAQLDELKQQMAQSSNVNR